MTILIILIAPRAGALTDKVGSRWLVRRGMTLLAVMLFYYTQLGAHESFFTILPGLLIGGVGMGMTMTPTTAAAMSAVAVDKAGVGSAVLNSARQVGGSLGIAVMGADRRRELQLPDRLPRRASHRLDPVPLRCRGGRARDPQGRAPPAGRRAGARRGAVTQAKVRLSKSERRQAVLDTACSVFSRSSYRGATTAEIAREAGISEPILYRHFGSKRDLYLACLDEAWASFRAEAEEAMASDPGGCLGAISDRYMAKGNRLRVVDLWIQALTEATEDPVISRGVAQADPRRCTTSSHA